MRIIARSRSITINSGGMKTAWEHSGVWSPTSRIATASIYNLFYRLECLSVCQQRSLKHLSHPLSISWMVG